MPLSTAQKDFIKSAIEHFLDFPLDETQLLSALNETVDKDKNEFYWLGECFKHPTMHFQQIERLQSQEKQASHDLGLDLDSEENKELKLSVYEVQKEILLLIYQTSQDVNSPLSRATIQEFNKLLSLNKKNKSIPFKSEKNLVSAGEHPWQLPLLSGKIYTQELYISEDSKNVSTDENNPVYIFTKNIYVKITIPDVFSMPYNKSRFVAKIPDSFVNSQQEQAFITKIQTKGEEAALECAAQTILKYLAQEKNLDHAITKMAQENLEVKKIITHDFWFQQLKKNNIQLRDIIDAKKETGDGFCHENIISLYSNFILTIKDILGLEKEDRLIISHPCYFKMIKNHILSLSEIKRVPHEIAFRFIHPFITSLIEKNKITFSQVRGIPANLNTILLNPIYQTFYNNNKINWQLFSTIDARQSKLFFDPEIMRLLFNNVITLKQIIEQAKIRKNWEDTCFHLITTTFAKRLFSIYQQSPCIINAVQDNINTIITEIESSANRLEDPLLIFKEWTFYYFVMHLKKQLKENLNALLDNDPRLPIYQEALDVCRLPSTNPEAPQALRFNNLIEFANKYANTYLHENIPTEIEQPSFSFFKITNTVISLKRKQPSADSDIQNMLRGLNAIAPLSTTMTEKCEVKRFSF